MNHRSTYLNIEDVLFGAILGAYLGTFVNVLTELYVLVIVAFFVLFPFFLRRFEVGTKYALVAFSLISVIVLVLMLRYFQRSNLLTDIQSTAFLIIFVGWLVSINARSYYVRKETILSATSVKTETIQLEDVKAVIFLVSDYQRKFENDKDFDLNSTMLYQILHTIDGHASKQLLNIWLVHEDSAEVPGSSSFIARDIKNRYGKKVHVEKIPVESSLDTQMSFEAVKHAFSRGINQYHLKVEDILCDVTGGTKPMSIGAALACEDGKKLVYSIQGTDNKWKFLRIDKVFN